MVEFLDDVWDDVKKGEIFENKIPFIVEDVVPTMKTENMTRFVVFSDTHCLHNFIPRGLPPGDVLLFCGDMSNNGFTEEIEDFVFYLLFLKFRYI
jgi:hypothetical protein